MEKLTIIVPCFNEEQGIPNLVSQLEPVRHQLQSKYETDLIFVDDGSNDPTVDRIKESFGDDKSVRILRHPKNIGLGAALRTGFAAAEGDLVVTLDSDCTYPPSEILRLLETLGQDTYVVTASPYHPQGTVHGVPPYRLLMSKTLSAFYRVLLRSDLYTFTALFRAYRKPAVKQVSFKADGFVATTEHLVGCLRAGFRVGEYPTGLYLRKYGTSKIKLLNTICDHLKLIGKLLVEHTGVEDGHHR